MRNRMTSVLLVVTAMVAGIGLPTGAQEATMANPRAVANPLLVKLPFAFPGPRMENTPIVYKDKPLLVQNVRGNTKAAGFYLFVQDLVTGDEITKFGDTFSFVSAFVNGDELNVFATENTDDDWTHDIYRFWTTDMKEWKKELAIPRKPGEHLFNASVCQDDQGYVMAFESNLPVQWSFRFARSEDLSKWEELDGICFADTTEKSACANPTLRYFAPHYYCIYGAWRWQGPGTWYEYRLPETKYVTFLARSKDLATWELSPTKFPLLDPVAGEGINNTDADLFEYAGNTYAFYATGDQQTWGTIRVAMYPGPLKQFFESYFPENVPMIVFNAREGKVLVSAEMTRCREQGTDLTLIRTDSKMIILERDDDDIQSRDIQSRDIQSRDIQSRDIQSDWDLGRRGQPGLVPDIGVVAPCARCGVGPRRAGLCGQPGRYALRVEAG